MNEIDSGEGRTVRHLPFVRRLLRAAARMRVRHRVPWRSDGFTMIDLLAALAFLAVMFVSFASLSTTTIKANHDARRITAAASLARDKIEELRALGYAAITSGSDSAKLTEAAETGGAAAIYTRSWTVVTGPSTTKEITVTVSWTDGTQHQAKLKTLIGDWS